MLLIIVVLRIAWLVGRSESSRMVFHHCHFHRLAFVRSFNIKVSLWSLDVRTDAAMTSINCVDVEVGLTSKSVDSWIGTANLRLLVDHRSCHTAEIANFCSKASLSGSGRINHAWIILNNWILLTRFTSSLGRVPVHSDFGSLLLLFCKLVRTLRRVLIHDNIRFGPTELGCRGFLL